MTYELELIVGNKYFKNYLTILDSEQDNETIRSTTIFCL